MTAVGASGQSPVWEAGPTMSVTSAYRVRGAIGKSYSHSVRSQELEQSTCLRASKPQLPNWKSHALSFDQQPEDISVVEQYQKLEDLFEHSPLDHDQIKLLSLLPSGDDVLCTIEKAELNSAAAQYEALSYCWGSDEQPKHTIWNNGHPYVVLSNLYAALKQLRKLTSTRKLWIDAICINQLGDEDKAEKSTQPPLMSRIYHQAASVIVWLGAAGYDSTKTLDITVQENVEAMQNREFAMDGRPVSGRRAIHEMDGRNYWSCLPSVEIPPIHGWWGSMSGMQHIWLSL